MGQFILYAEQQTNGQSDAASAAAIQAVLQSVITYQDNSCNITIGGSWVGAPRITRQAALNLTGNDRFTRFAALFQYPDGNASDAAIQNCIKSLADLGLTQSNVGWQPSQIIAYNPATNGSIDWWTSGQAAATHTQNSFDLNQQIGGTNTIENPTGPQAATGPANLNPGTPLGLTPDAVSQGLSFLTTAMYFVAGGVAIYFLWPVLMGARNVASASLQPRRRSAAVARANPRRSSRKRSKREKFGLKRLRSHKNPVVRAVFGF